MKPLSLKAVAALCAAGCAATVAFAAMAQNGPPPGGPGGPRGQVAQGRGGGGRSGNPAERMQQLHDQLQLSPAQEPAFQAWQTALQPKGPAVRPGALRRMTTPQRLDEELAQQTQRDGDLKARVAATKTFYNQLTATQRQTLDGLPPQQLLAMEAMGDRGGRRGGGRGGRRGGGGGGGFDPNAGFGGPQSFGAPPPQ